MSTITHAGHATGAEATGLSLKKRIIGLFARINRARSARRDFESLSGASEYLLADIGLTKAQLDIALAAPFWVNPSDRLGAGRRRTAR